MVAAAVRSFVYGGLDGIITVFALVTSSHGASVPPLLLVCLALANMLADALSMAMGDYLRCVVVSGVSRFVCCLPEFLMELLTLLFFSTKAENEVERLRAAKASRECATNRKSAENKLKKLLKGHGYNNTGSGRDFFRAVVVIFFDFLPPPLFRPFFALSSAFRPRSPLPV
jgi:VIT family